MNIQNEQNSFRDSKPSRFGRGLDRVTHPFGKALAGAIPDGLVEGVLKGLDKAVGAPKLTRISHDTADIRAAQRAAKQVAAAGKGISASTGAAAGLGGALSMGADIPATMAIALRIIRDTGRAYGFDGDGPSEKLFRLQILELAALDNPDVRSARIAELEAGIGDLGELRDTHPDHITPIVDQAVERVSRAIAFASFRSRAGMIVPLVGSLVGSAVNFSFQGDVGKAARFAFQERWLRRNENTIEAAQPSK